MKIGAVSSGFFVLIMLILTVWVTPALATSSVQASRTAAQASLPIYRLKPPIVTTQELTRLAGIFGMKGQPVELDDRLALRVGSQTIEIYKASGAVWYADESQLFNPSLNPDLPTQAEAREIADTFLTVNELKPPEATFDTFAGTILMTVDAIALQETTRQLDVQAIYGFNLNGLPVGCGGGKLKVTVGDQGQIIGFFRVWREIDSQVGVFQVLDQSTADQMFRESLHGFQTRSFSSTLEYCSAPAPEAQGFLAPAYIYNWDFQSDEMTFPGRSSTMPATSFAPLVRITSPPSGTTLSTTHLQATSVVSGGTPPYTFRWESSVDGLLGTGEELSASLSSGWRDDTPLSHAITLTVTDSNGLTATDAIEVSVGVPSPAVGGTVEQVSLVGAISTVLGFVALVALTIGLLMWRRRRPTLAVMFIALSFFLAAGVPSRAHAAEYDGWEAGTEWIGPSMGLDYSSADVRGFLVSMKDARWTVSFNYGEHDAWDADFKDKTLGGWDDKVVDSVDFVFYTGHAGMDGIALYPPIDRDLHYDEAMWGQTDLEWLVIAACGPLEDDHLNGYGAGEGVLRWRGAFQGLHQLLGYGADTGQTIDEGRLLGRYMMGLGTDPLTIRVAWIRTGIDVQPTRNAASPPYGPLVWVVVMWAFTPTADPSNDYLPGFGSYSADPYPPSGFAIMATVT